ncbi:twin-arginine translocase subunit TatC [Thalassospira sp.]|uniref:twin-arginine translocase subunit TatC n=1 Tax=Thalassospira sp. TaxID=1912094 RepID=UPI00273391E9|nr:twin-arginine translocase subunit TatC [Thalassospira sp.]MDP2697966.1 twin-arginine translocase subunit TatC [Thalassospira sp.]
MQSQDKQMPIMEHLIELRNRLTWAVLALFITFGICYFFVEDIYGFLVRPLAEAMGPGENRRMIYTALTEVFFTYVKVSFFAACFLSAPVFLGQLWAFVAPGLYKNERSAFYPFLFATPVLFAAGGALVYYFIMPLAWTFFLSFETSGAGTGGMAIQLEAKVGEYLSLVMKLIFAFGLSFQLPVLLTLMARAGIVTAESLAKRRKYAVVIAFVMAAIMTPPDLISQVGLAIPIVILYEISIVMARLAERKRARREAEEEAEEAAEQAETTKNASDDGVDAQAAAAASMHETDTKPETKSSSDSSALPDTSKGTDRDEDDFNNAR